MSEILELLKSITDNLKLTNSVLQIIDSFSKVKDKLIPIITVTSVAVITIICFNDSADGIDPALWRMLLLVVLCCHLILLLYHYHCHNSYKKKLTKLEVSFKEDLSALKQLDDQKQGIIVKNYYQLLRDSRNTINMIEKYHKSPDQNLTEPITSCVYRFTRDALGYLTDIFTCVTGEKISGCVKVMLADDFNAVDYNTAFVKTFARSTNTSTQRVSYHAGHPNPVKLSENTDFMEIVSDNRINPSSCFYQGNLPEYDEKLQQMNRKYENTTENYDSFYKGTIVAPIRIANQYLFYTSSNEGYNTLGFLCVDSESDTAFPAECEEEYTYIMRAFAAVLYHVLSKYQFYLAEINRNSNSKTMNASDGVDVKKKVTGNKKRKNAGIWIQPK